MNIVLPKITGIVGHVRGHIQRMDGRPALHGTKYEGIDKSIFREYMKQQTEGNTPCMIVSGKNNLSQMSSLLQKISDKDFWIGMDASEEADIYYGGDFNREIPRPDVNEVYRFCVNRGIKNIIVLGGRSVYHEFSGAYHHFVEVCVDEEPTEMTDKKINPESSLNRISRTLYSDGENLSVIEHTFNN